VYVHVEDDEKAVKEAQQEAARRKRMERERRREKMRRARMRSDISLQNKLKRKTRSSMEAPEKDMERRRGEVGSQMRLFYENEWSFIAREKNAEL